MLVNREITLDLNLKNIEEEIELRVMSLKSELDEIFLQFKYELKNIKKDIIRHLNLLVFYRKRILFFS